LPAATDYVAEPGGAQMFKEEEKGTTRVNFDRTDEAIGTGANIIAAACPFL